MVGLIRGRSEGGAWGLLCGHPNGAGDAAGLGQWDGGGCKASDVMYNAALVRWATGSAALQGGLGEWFKPAVLKTADGVTRP